MCASSFSLTRFHISMHLNVGDFLDSYEFCKGIHAGKRMELGRARGNPEAARTPAAARMRRSGESARPAAMVTGSGTAEGAGFAPNAQAKGLAPPAATAAGVPSWREMQGTAVCPIHRRSKPHAWKVRVNLSGKARSEEHTSELQ